ncbi:hypothetical protein W97_07855 [Coniosporium apollinis CBS 100218]|uniref:Copper-fist domain-containing protein n=1 Tax=Coniosporium apollinis (strain CBS 100218) TaxID=1168221 RepID=R7Z385_CONA1|nr:uncharacterized protein W97_07855 [Coniosporium apollinis CBS 100218]EON68597.1 hypothetical protein W97_07855 [Coniosporium apollinis CBS 100218]
MTPPDRELQRINPKGRPVKQCEHCRGARQSRSHHTKCECGDKKPKGSSKGEASGTPEVEGDSHPHAVDDQSCRCYSGLPCICGMKREHHDLKMPTGLSKASHPMKHRPPLTATHSEANMTVFANGHHKPYHRLNNAAHTSGVPYKIPRAHTLHGPSYHSRDHLQQTDGSENGAGQGPNADCTLPSSNDDSPFSGFGFSNRSADTLPLAPVTSGMSGDIASYDPSRSNYGFVQAPTAPGLHFDGSNEPNVDVASGLPVTRQWPWVNTDVPSASQPGYGDSSASPTGAYFATHDVDWAIPSAGFTDPSWTAWDLPLDPAKLSGGELQLLSHSGDSNLQGVPSLTASSSGAQSEIGEPGCHHDVDLWPQQQSVNTEELSAWDESFHSLPLNPSRFSSASLHVGDLRHAPTSVPANIRHSLNLDLIRPSHNGSFVKQRARAGTAESKSGHGNSSHLRQMQQLQQPSKTGFGFDGYFTSENAMSSAYATPPICSTSMSEPLFIPGSSSASMDVEPSGGAADWSSLLPNQNSGLDNSSLISLPASLPPEWNSAHLNWL